MSIFVVAPNSFSKSLKTSGSSYSAQWKKFSRSSISPPAEGVPPPPGLRRVLAAGREQHAAREHRHGRPCEEVPSRDPLRGRPRGEDPRLPTHLPLVPPIRRFRSRPGPRGPPPPVARRTRGPGRAPTCTRRPRPPRASVPSAGKPAEDLLLPLREDHELDHVAEVRDAGQRSGDRVHRVLRLLLPELHRLRPDRGQGGPAVDRVRRLVRRADRPSICSTTAFSGLFPRRSSAAR